MTPAEREQLDIATEKLVGEEKQARITFIHFSNFSALALIFLIIFGFKVDSLDTLTIVEGSTLLIISVLVWLKTHALYFEWNFFRRVLCLYAMPVGDFNKQFEDFCLNDKEFVNSIKKNKDA